MNVTKPNPYPPTSAQRHPEPGADPERRGDGLAALAGFSATRAERGSRAQSRHLIPTAACTMQSGQIGLPQFEHET